MFSSRDWNRRPPRILHIISSSAASGAEVQLADVSVELQKSGCVVEVVCPIGGWLPARLRTLGIRTYEMPLKGRALLWTVLRTAWIARARRFDVLHTHLSRAAYIGFAAGMLARLPIAASVHVVNRDWIYPKIARKRNRLIAVSEFVRWFLHIRSVPDAFIRVAPNGTGYLRTPPDAGRTRANLGLPEGKRLFAMVGRMGEQKGHILAAEAMPKVLERHPEACLVLVGRAEVDVLERFEHVVDQLNIRHAVHRLGEREDVDAILDAVEFTVMPSSVESFGIAAIESMARGKPVVASRRGALPEIVRSRVDGLIVDLNSDSLADGILWMLESPERTRAFGERAKDSVRERFTLERSSEILQSVYREMLS